MGVNLPHALGRTEKYYAMAEGAFDTFVKPTGAGAVKVLKSQMGVVPGRKDYMEKTAFRDTFEKITGKNTVNWSNELDVIPSGFRGEAPDDATSDAVVAPRSQPASAIEVSPD